MLACVKVIADGCATPDLNVFRELQDGTRQKATNIPEYRLLSRRPNEWQTSFEWRRQMTIHAALTGAGCPSKVRGDNRRVRELIPVMPGNWDVRKVSRYELRYRCWDEFGMIGEFSPGRVRPERRAMGLGGQHECRVPGPVGNWPCHGDTERSQAAMHANGLRPSGTYSVDATLNEEQHKRLSAWIKKDRTEPRWASRWFWTVTRSGNRRRQTGVDAQHVETGACRLRKSAVVMGCSLSWLGTPTRPAPLPAPGVLCCAPDPLPGAMAPGMDATY